MFYQSDGCIHTLFEKQAALRPDALAAVFEQSRLSYRELDQRANQVARALRTRGVGPDTLVGICLDPSLETLVGILGILKAGGAYVPLDPAYPADRLSFMLEDARIESVVTTRALLKRLPNKVPFSPLRLDDPAVTSEPTTRVETEVRPNHLAYVIYTSGSTGRPKGVLVQHDHVARLFTTTDAWFGFGPSDVWTMFHSFAFDFSVWEIWGALLYGGRVVVVPWRVSRDPEAFYELLQREQVTVLNQTPSAFQQLLPVDERRRVPALALRYVVFGGEALDLGGLRGWFERHGDSHPRLINMYGITETTVHVTYRPLTAADAAGGKGSLIGVPLPDLQFHLLDGQRRPVPIGEVGEIYVGGAGVARGYLNRPELNAQRFVPDGFSGVPGARLYRSGDLACRLPDGEVEYRGRADDQVKIGGHRIELGEIEAVLSRHPAARQIVVLAREDTPGDKRLIAYAVPTVFPAPTLASDLRAFAKERLPPYLAPSFFAILEKFPINVNGKVDRRALPRPRGQRPDLHEEYVTPSTNLERRLAALWEELLGLAPVGANDSFFDLGGESLLAVRLTDRLRQQGFEVPVTKVYERPQLAHLARWLENRPPVAGSQSVRARADRAAVAIVGMAGRFPGADSVERFWKNLCDGLDTIRTFSDADLDPVIPLSIRSDPAYVKARGILDNVELFDAAFFGLNPKEAAMMDPQQRLLLELAWEALERSGHVPARFQGAIGVFAGKNFDAYYDENLRTRPDLIEEFGELNTMLGNDKHFIATRIAHKLDLTGPALSVHTACSTSLVAVCQAVQNLRIGECDLALAGGVSITVPVRSGYLYQEGGMLSPDGRCRPFDAHAGGTVFSDGAALLVLRRLEDALADGDTVYAVIRGVALNNDGARRASFTAPSVEGQAAVISRAMADANVEPRSISYVETHGTATPLGDPIELEALTKAFRTGTADQNFCAIGSVKSNVGHLIMAAGAAGLIKTALALQQHLLPPTLYFQSPNPHLDFAHSPFFVQTKLSEWVGPSPRRAGVSSFGVGGTNAHVILEEPPPADESGPARPKQLLVFSARTPSALEQTTVRLREHLLASPSVSLADVAFTLQQGRQAFAHRRFLVGDDIRDAVAGLDPAAKRLQSRHLTTREPPVVFMFPGQGSQHVDMARNLYQGEPIFRAAVDRCAEALRSEIEGDLRRVLYPEGDPTTAATVLQQTAYTQPALFTIEFALATLWQSWGVRPEATIGHSVGEFVGAALAGVMPVEDAVRLVAARGRLMQALPTGSMLSVNLSAPDAAERIGGRPQLAIASHNAPQLCVIAGPTEEIEQLQRQLEADGLGCRRLVTSHAFHSPMMDPAIEPFAQRVRQIPLAPPRLPFVSTVSGTWITDAQATDPAYWADHLRATVRFAAGVQTLLEKPDRVLLEVGPRATLTAMVRRQAKDPAKTIVVPSQTDSSSGNADNTALSQAAGQLWLAGVPIDWKALHAGEKRRRIVLPTYPFERKRYWIEPAAPPVATGAVADVVPEVLTSVAPAIDSTIGPLPTSDRSQEQSVSTSAQPSSPPQKRFIALREMFEEVTGLDFADTDPSATFVELGLDSLFLTQAALQIQKRFGVKVTFRQLMESFSSLQTLAAHLDSQLPPEFESPAALVPAIAPKGNATPIAPATGPVTGRIAMPNPTSAPGTIQYVIDQQLQLMAQQLALLTSGSESPPTVNTTRNVSEKPDSDDQQKYDPQKAFGAIARIHASSSTDLTPKQRARLEALTRRYNARTKESKRLTQANRSHLADPRVVTGFKPMTKELTYQIIVSRSAGSHLWDVDGNEYVDALCGFGSCLLGWQPPFVTEAVKRQLDTGHEIGPMTPLAGEVAKLICEMTGFDRAGFCNTGSEAVMGTMRIARTVTGRSTIALFSGSYHGVFDEVIVRGTKKLKSIPAAPGILPNASLNALVLDYGTPETLEIIRQRASELAAVLVEPVQSRRPDFRPREFLQEIRAITQRAGAALIFDEVVNGFRTCPGGAQEYYGIRADLASYGKVIGGGFPVGVIAGRREWADALDGGFWQYGDDSVPTVGVTYFAGTFCRHPLALAASKAVLEYLQSRGPSLQQELNAKTESLAAELNTWLDQVKAPIHVNHFSSLWRTIFTQDLPLADLLFVYLRDHGVHILEGFPCFLTTAHTQSDIDFIVKAFQESVTEMQEAGFLPEPSPRPQIAQASAPPVPGARLGRDSAGNPTWYIPNPAEPGKYIPLEV